MSFPTCLQSDGILIQLHSTLNSYIKSERNINQLLTEKYVYVSLSNNLKQKNFVCIVTVTRGKQIQIKTSSGNKGTHF